MWRELVERGLRRCLFGVESGVTSILERFNKETTGEQNALADPHPVRAGRADPLHLHHVRPR